MTDGWLLLGRYGACPDCGAPLAAWEIQVLDDPTRISLAPFLHPPDTPDRPDPFPVAVRAGQSCARQPAHGPTVPDFDLPPLRLGWSAAPTPERCWQLAGGDPARFHLLMQRAGNNG